MAILYDDEFLAKAIRSDYSYGTTVRLSGPERALLAIVKVGMALVYAVIWVLARLPIVGAVVESLVTFYPRGAVGFFLRGAYYKQVLGHLGRNSLIDIGVSIFNPRNVRIGDGTHIDSYVKIEGGGPVAIGSYNHIASFTILAGRGGLTTGDYVGISAGSMLYSASNHYTDRLTDTYFIMSACAPADLQFVKEQPVVMEEHSFIGMNTIVLPGVRIRRGVVIGAGSIVTEDVPAWMVAVGTPARPIKERWPRPDGWDRPEGSSGAAEPESAGDRLPGVPSGAAAG